MADQITSYVVQQVRLLPPGFCISFRINGDHQDYVSGESQDCSSPPLIVTIRRSPAERLTRMMNLAAAREASTRANNTFFYELDHGQRYIRVYYGYEDMGYLDDDGLLSTTSANAHRFGKDGPLVCYLLNKATQREAMFQDSED